MAITPDGTKAYVVNGHFDFTGTMSVIDTATDTVSTTFNLNIHSPWGIAITPDGTKAYITDEISNLVTPLTIATNTLGTDITVGSSPLPVAITPDGKAAYVGPAIPCQ